MVLLWRYAPNIRAYRQNAIPRVWQALPRQAANPADAKGGSLVKLKASRAIEAC